MVLGGAFYGFACMGFRRVLIMNLGTGQRAGGVLQHLFLKEVSCPFRDHPLDVFSHSSSDKNTIS